MNFFETFITTYGEAILYAVLTTIAGFLGTQLKRIYEKLGANFVLSGKRCFPFRVRNRARLSNFTTIVKCCAGGPT